MAVRLDAAVCLDLPVVCPSTCSGYPCVSGYESRQTRFAQAGVTHDMLVGWDPDCWSFLMSYVQYLFDRSFCEVFLCAFFVTCECGHIKLKDKRTFVLHCICIVTQDLFGNIDRLCCRRMMPFFYPEYQSRITATKKKTSTEMQTQF